VTVHAVSLPEQRALAGIALSRAGVPVDAADMVDVFDASRSTLDEFRGIRYSLEDVLLVLTLGFKPA